MLTSLLPSLFVAMVAGAGVLALGHLALRNSTATLALLLAVWVATGALRDAFDLSITVSGVRVSALDVVCAILATVGIARILSDGVQNVARGLALALFVLLAFHIARGVAQFGTQTAVNDARGWLYFTSALLYAATVPGGWDRRAWKLLAATGVLLAAVAVPYFLTEGLGSASTQIFRNGEWVTSRPIIAAGALLILQAAILAPALRWPSRQTAIYVAIGAGAVALLLQHRTVWMAGALVAVVGFFWWSARSIRRSESAVFAATGAVLLLLPIAVFGFAQTGPLIESAKSATSSDSTFTWRTTGWNELLSTHDSPSNLATGQAAGGSFDRLINGQVVNVSPHDGFVDAYIRFGLPGLLCVLWLGWLLWSRRTEVAARTGLTDHAVGLLILSQLVFSVAYGLDAIQGMIAGILVAGLSTVPARVPALIRSREDQGRSVLGQA